jgi:hypothetical protein
MGSNQSSPGASISSARITQHSTILVLNLHGGGVLESLGEVAQKPQFDPWKRLDRAGGHLRSKGVQCLEAAGGERYCLLCHLVFEARNPRGVGSGLGQEPISLAHEILKIRQTRGVIRIEACGKAVT